MRLTLPRERYPGEAAGAFFERLSSAWRRCRACRAVVGRVAVPADARLRHAVRGRRRPGGRHDAADGAHRPSATPSYFETLRVPLARRARSSARPIASTRRRSSSSTRRSRRGICRQPIRSGTSRIGSPERRGPWTTIVGVVADSRNSGVTQPVRPEIFIPVRQQTDVEPALPAGAHRRPRRRRCCRPSRQTVASLDPEQPVYAIQTLEEALATSSFQQRISAVLLGIFAAVALVLAAIGIYGVMSYSVSARTQEIGVRLAVGAQRRDVIWLVLGQVLRLSAIGLAIGIGVDRCRPRARGRCSSACARRPGTIAAVTFVLGAVALIAAWVPASRASKTDPIQALRNE